MQEIQPSRTYRARLCDRAVGRAQDGRSRFKVYFVDIVGRPEPRRYEWEASGLDREALLAALGAVFQGVGFVIAFPHIVKLFRFSPAAEIVLDVRALSPPDLQPLPLERAEGYVEFACLAEALIAADEYRLWAEAGDVPEYLGGWSDFREAGIARHRKMLDFFRPPGPEASAESTS